MKNEVILPIVLLSTIVFNQAVIAKSTIGGIVFTNIYFNDFDDGTESISKTKIEVPGNSRIRVRWDNEDNVSLYTEVGFGEKGVKLRHAWGRWDIDESWQILAGQTSTPFAPLNPSVAMVHNSGESVGNVSPGRQPQVRFTYKFLNRQGAVALAILDPNKGDTLQDAVNSTEKLGEKDAKIPRVDLGAAFTTANWQFFPSAFYQYQTYTSLKTKNSDDSLNSWGISLGAKTGYGPFIMSAEIGGGQNWGNTKMSLSGSPAGDNSGATTYIENGLTRIADSDNLGYWIDLGYRFTIGQYQGTAHLIYGGMHSERSKTDEDYHSEMLGLSVPIDLPWVARGFRIRPEFFYFKHGDQYDGATGERTDAGSQFVSGVQLQFTF